MRLKSRPVPAWAMKLIVQISDEEGIKSPRVTWQKTALKRNLEGSSGTAWPFHIRITAGTDRKLAKKVLIHEMCHVILGQTGAFRDNRGHAAEFYAKLFEVGKRHGLGAAYIKQNEHWYKPRGVKAGYALYLRRNRA